PTLYTDKLMDSVNADDNLRDTIVVYATIKGHAAQRYPENGTLFVTSLFKVLSVASGFCKDIFRVLRNVQRELLMDEYPQLMEFTSYGVDDMLSLKPPTHIRGNDQRTGALCIEVNYLFCGLQDERSGSLWDGYDLLDLFLQEKVIFQFLNETTVNQSLIASIKDVIEQYASRYNILLLFIMSHGVVEKGKLYLKDSRGSKIAVDDILDLLQDTNSPSLKGKQKLVFVQVCRGGATISHDLKTTSQTKSTSNDSEKKKNSDLSKR
ncbi:caspase-3-like protein, partial [Leptotrombidium deliense]